MVNKESFEMLKIEKIKEEQGFGFWADLMGTIYCGNWRGQTSGIMSAERIAEILGITTETAEAFLRECYQLGLTERQGGGWVV